MKRYGIKSALMLSMALLGLKSYGQQNIQFTQYIFNSISVNPAYAGYKEEWFAQAGMRTQWTGVDGAPKTGTISVDGVLDEDKRHGVGLQVTADQLGAQSATSVYANYALRLRLDRRDEHRLALGIAAGATQYGLDGRKLIYHDQEDGLIPDHKIADWKPDVRLGVYYSNPKWYAGLAVHDLFSSGDSGDDYQYNLNSFGSIYRNVNAYFITGMLVELDRGLLLRPSILVKDDFKGPTALDVNAMFIFNDKFWIGAGYRTRAKLFNRAYTNSSTNKVSSLNSINAVTQFYVSPKFRIGYSYDHMLNRLSKLANGTHEVSLGVTFGRSGRQVMNPRYF